MDSFTIPLTVTCTVSGQQKTYTSREYIEKCLARHGGSLTAFLSSYVCRDAQRMLKDGSSHDEIKAALGKQGASYTPTADTIKARRPVQIRVNDQPLATDETPPEPKKIKSYPPGYFSSPVQGVINWAEATHDTCFYPPIHSSGDCSRCRLFSVCTLPSKQDPAVSSKRRR